MPHYNILFLGTGNAARSIMAEAIMNKKGASHFTAYSAGSRATGEIHPRAIQQLESVQLPTEHLRSKNWEEFATPDAPEMHFVFTLCDLAAQEVCPIWPGHPMTGHWSVPDPAAAEGSAEEIERAFRSVFFMLERRISLFLTLPLASIDTLSLKKEFDAWEVEGVGRS